MFLKNFIRASYAFCVRHAVLIGYYELDNKSNHFYSAFYQTLDRVGGAILLITLMMENMSKIVFIFY